MFSKEFTTTSNLSFIKLDDGDKVTGVFAGEPYECMYNFKEQEEYAMGLPSYPEGTSKKFKINFLRPWGNPFKSFSPNIFSGGTNIAKAIEAIVGKYGMAYLYEISRQGAGKKTTYSILPERPLTEEERAVLPTISLHELTLRE